MTTLIGTLCDLPWLSWQSLWWLGMCSGGLVMGLLMWLWQTATRSQDKASADRYQALVLATAQVVWLVDANGKAISTTTGWQLLTGQRMPDLQGDGWLEAIHPDDRDRVQHAWHTAVTTRCLYDVKCRITTGEGDTRHLHIRGVPVLFPSGDVREWVGTCTDITEQTLAEQALRQKEAQYRSIFESVNDALHVFDVETGLLVEANPAAHKMHGYTYEEFLQLHPAQFIHPDSHHLFQEFLTAVHAGRSFYCEAKNVRRDGTVIDIDVRGTGFLYNNKFHVLSIVRDITEAKRAEAERQRAELALRSSEERLRSLLACLPVGVYTATPEGQCTWVNPKLEDIAGFTLEEALGDGWAENIHPDDLETVLSGWKAYTSTGRSYPVEYRRYHSDGSLRWVRNNTAPLFSLQGDMIGHVGVITDITEQRRIEDALQRSEERLRLTLDFNNIGIWEWDLQSNTMIWNDNHFRLMGLEPGESKVIYHVWHDRIHPDDLERVDQAIDSALINQTDLDVEYRVVYPDGTVHWVVDRARGVYTPDGKAVQMLGIVIDITDQKQVELALRQNREQLRLVMQHMPVMLDAVDEAGNIILWNKECERVTGYTADEIVGNPTAFELLYPDADYRQSMLTEWARRGNNYRNWDWVVTCKDGTLRTTSWSNISDMVPISGWGTWGIGIDITEQKQAEAALRAERDLLDGIMNTSVTAIVVIDPQGKVLFANTQAEKILGVTTEELTQRRYNSAEWQPTALDGSLWTDEQQPFHRVITTGEPVFDVQHTIVRPDGTRCYLSVNGAPIKDAQGNIQRLVFSVSDITDRVMADLALRDSKAQFQAFMDYSPTAAWIDTIDGYIVYVSQSYAHMSPFPTQDFIGKHITDLFPPETAQAYLAEIHQVAQTKQALEKIQVSPRADGSMGEFLVYKFPIPSNSGQLLVGGVAIDITDRRQAEEKLRQQEKNFRALAENSPDIIERFDTQKRHTYVSPALEALTGIPQQAFLGKTCRDLGLDEAMVTTWETAFHATLATKQRQSIEFELPLKDGLHYYEAVLTPEFGDDGEVASILSIARDVTDRKRSEHQIRASLREKEVLLKEIHHRVKNNLQIVDGLLQMQCRRTQNAQAVTILRDSRNRIASIALVHEKLYRSEDLANINFAQYIPDLTAHLFDSYLVDSSTIRFYTQIDDITLDIDIAIPCGLIINELVSNALKYAFPEQPQGAIWVKFFADDRTLTLIVQDNGVGLPASFNLNNPHSLGLTLVQGLVDQLDGSLEITSQAGTTFHITFPWKGTQ
jgi:PAS domain S-box-containing protein